MVVDVIVPFIVGEWEEVQKLKRCIAYVKSNILKEMEILFPWRICYSFTRRDFYVGTNFFFPFFVVFIHMGLI